MRCPNVQPCPVCGRLLIHRGERSAHESASYIGQCIHNMLPQRKFFVGDVDVELFRRELGLWRTLEHKSPHSELGKGQESFLRFRARVFEHLLKCPTAPADLGFPLHPRSGVFKLQGDPHEGNQLGPHVITKLSGAGKAGDKPWLVEDEFTILRWIPLLDRPEDLAYLRERLRRRRLQPIKPPGAAA